MNIPDVDRAWMSAPAFTSRRMASALFSLAAHISAVCPRNASRVLTSAPLAISAWTAAVLPVRAAIINGVSPAGVAKFASAPAASSRLMIDALPLVAARWRGAMP